MALTKDTEILKPLFHNVPGELKAHDNWVLWKKVRTKNSTYTKVPYYTKTKKASSTDSKTWLSFDKAKALYDEGGFDGIGFVFDGTSKIIGIDLDNIDSKKISDHKFIDNWKDKTYTELSPSGNGVHLYIIADVPDQFHPGFNNKDGNIEAYSMARFFTVTGHVLGTLEVTGQQELANKLYNKYGTNIEPMNNLQALLDIPVDESMDAKEVLRRIEKSTNQEKKDRILTLLNTGDYQSLGFESHSNADYSLINDLLFYSDLNYQLVYEMMSESPLCGREKWESPRRHPLHPETHTSYGYYSIVKCCDQYLTQNKKTYSTYHLKRAEDEFEEIAETQCEDNKEWLKRLEINSKSGTILNSRRNMKLIIENDSKLKNIFKFNEFSSTREIRDKPFWRLPGDTSVYWTDNDESALKNYISNVYGVEGDNRIRDLLNETFYKNTYHPVKEYLDSLEWDGEPRLNSLFIDYLGAPNTAYIKRITELSFIGAIKRVYEPGCKHDTMIVLYGHQGVGKSYILKRLAKDWFNDSIIKISDKDGYMALQGSWIIEFSELASWNKKEVEDVKQFVSSQVDTYREPYQRHQTRKPRQCVFFGTTNNREFLTDSTGARRFYPIDVGTQESKFNVFSDLTDEVINQIWAEAVDKYRLGLSNVLDPNSDGDIIEQAQEVQKLHTEDDGLADRIIAYLDTPLHELDGTLGDVQEDDYEYLDRINWEMVWDNIIFGKGMASISQKRKINNALNSIEFLEPKSSIRFTKYDFTKKYGHTRGFMVNR
ncbi:VapE domain-containing protein [Macrococcus capreoli]|uniref:VapE domain-containing protein n=1 Tax=Macrococcus capreoli TaxID=2982690 RepID=UPI003F43129A